MDCQVSEWTNGTCTAPCGEGTRIDRRTVIQQAQNGGRACPDLEREEVCDTDPNGGECDRNQTKRSMIHTLETAYTFVPEEIYFICGFT